MPTFGVNVVILYEDQVLLTLRRDWPVWCLPGGAIEAGESLVEAAVREVYEETGAEVEISRIVGVYSRPNWLADGNHEVVFAGKQVGGELRPQDGESQQVSYFPIEVLPETLLWWHHERIADAITANEAVARTQDVRWPVAGRSVAETRELIAAGRVSESELVTYFCTKPAGHKKWLL